MKTANDSGISKEWAKAFLLNWNRAVQLWDSGRLFADTSTYDIMVRSYISAQQREYAKICCTWLIPNRISEPHVVALGSIE